MASCHVTLTSTLLEGFLAGNGGAGKLGYRGSTVARRICAVRDDEGGGRQLAAQERKEITQGRVAPSLVREET
jgi:hypothetical protein